MGCFDSKLEAMHNLRVFQDQTKWIDTPVGKLVLQVKNIYLEKLENKDVRRSDLLLKIRLSNHEELLKVEELSKSLDQSRKIPFAINSCYRCYGRFLLVEVWNLNANKEKDTGLGFINLEDIILKEKQQQSYCKKLIKTYINYSNEPGGFIQFWAEFKPYEYDELTLKINSAFLEKHVEERTFSAKVIIGQQSLQTKPIKVNERNLLIWKDELLSFRVPDFIEYGRLQIIQKKGSSDLFWGEYQLNVKEFLFGANHQVEIDDNLEYEDEVCGRIRLSSKKGNKQILTFREIDSPKRGKHYEQSIKVTENLSVTSNQNIESVQEGTEIENFSYGVYRNQKANSLPPLDVNEALKKLQFKRKKKAADA